MTPTYKLAWDYLKLIHGDEICDNSEHPLSTIMFALKLAEKVEEYPSDDMCEAAWESEGVDYVGEHKRIWQISPAFKAMIDKAIEEITP